MAIDKNAKTVDVVASDVAGLQIVDTDADADTKSEKPPSSPAFVSHSGWDGKLRVKPQVNIQNPEALIDPEYSDDDNVNPGEVIAADEDILDGEDPETDEILLTQARVHSIAALRLGRFPKVERVCLRQNAISTLMERPVDDRAGAVVGADSDKADKKTQEAGQAEEISEKAGDADDADDDDDDKSRKTCPLAVLADTLADLDLYDNLISHMRGVETLPNLTSLDLSFNKIKTIKHLEGLAKLRDLYLVANKISSVEGLEGIAAAATLRMLELGSNRLRSIEPLGGYGFAALEELWVAKNKITSLEGIQGLPKLRLLSVQSNRLRDLSPVRGVPTLEELYVSHNAIESLASLRPEGDGDGGDGGEPVLTKLRVLDISNNRLKSLHGTEHLSALEEVWASYNFMVDFDDVQKCLGDKKALETVYLEGNTLQLRQPALYRNKVRLALPQVKQIDATYV